MRALGLVNRTVREINEMRYEFDEPFIVDASRAETELGLRATPLADAVEQTVRWYRHHAGAPVTRASQSCRSHEGGSLRMRDRGAAQAAARASAEGLRRLTIAGAS